jgi:hypothetical protein
MEVKEAGIGLAWRDREGAHDVRDGSKRSRVDITLMG